MLVVDMRLFGVGLREQRVSELAADAHPWFLGSLAESIKCYYSFAFWVKMTCLALAILFTLTVKRKVAFAEDVRIAPIWQKLVAIVSVSLWAGVGWGGRWIGFSP